MAHIGMHVRPAVPGDIPLIRSLIRELADYEKAPEQAVATEQALHQHLFGDSWTGIAGRRGPVAECLIGEVDGVPEGFAVYFTNFSTWLGTPGIYLEDLFVRPAARGRGLGKALLQAVAAVAVSRGCGRMDWSVLDWNRPAIEFYESLGATPMSEWTTYRVSGEALAGLARGQGK